MGDAIRVLLFALGLLLASHAKSEVTIDRKHWVTNDNHRSCSWAALETLANHYGLSTLAGIRDERASEAGESGLRRVLDERKVPYDVQPAGNFGTEILGSVYRGRGVIVGLKPASPRRPGHAVLVVDLLYDRGLVRVIDPDVADGKLRELTWSHFLARWDGFALSLRPG